MGLLSISFFAYSDSFLCDYTFACICLNKRKKAFSKNILKIPRFTSQQKQFDLNPANENRFNTASCKHLWI